MKNHLVRRGLIAFFALIVAWSGLGLQPASADEVYNMPHYIEVDLTNQLVTVYNTRDDSVACQMLCSAGMNGSTPTGTWYMPEKTLEDERTEWYYMKSYSCWVKYATKIFSAYFFHSIPYQGKKQMSPIAASKFGVPASHGCIRLRVEDAKYIAENCLAGTRVHIFKSGEENNDLRELLIISSFCEDDGITYQEFLGYSKDALGLDSRGDVVQELQLRLHDLGYFDGKIDGYYQKDTLAAVKRLQKDLGIAQSGVTSVELRDVIFSDDAPVSAGTIALKEGSSGPVVKKLQTALDALGLYDGDLDSVYDADVIESVKDLQRLCGYSVDGVASPEIQHLAYYEVDRIQRTLGSDYSMERITEEVNMATMTFGKSKIIVREKPNTKSAEVAKLGKGDTVILLATQGDWAEVFVSGRKGYLYKKYLSPYTTQNYVVKYTANGQTITIGNTLEEMTSGTGTNEQEEFRNYYASAQYTEYLDDAVEYVTVDTGAQNVKLNMRAEATTESDTLAEVPNGTNLRVLAREDGWTRVGYDDQIGYLMNQYLNFWEGSASAVKDTTDAIATSRFTDDQKITAIVMPNKNSEWGYVYIYGAPKRNAKVIGHVPGNSEVDVVSVDEDRGWVCISVDGREGYLPDSSLSFRLGE